MNSNKTYEQNNHPGCHQLLPESGTTGGRPAKRPARASFQVPGKNESALPLLNELPVGLIAFSPAEELLWANAYFLGLMSRERAAIRGITVRQLFPDEDYTRVKRWLNSGALQQQDGLEVGLRDQTGEELRVRLRHLPSLATSSYKNTCWLSVECLSERQAGKAQLERALAEAQKSQEVQQRFLASMSHEIRNSANVIAGIAEAFQEGHFSFKELQHLQYTADLLLHLTENLLYYSKIREDKFQLAQGLFSLQELLSSLAQVPVVFLRQSQVSFEFHQDPRLPAYCWGDKAAIYQIILNLLSNALKFTQEGSITFRVEMLEKDAKGRVVVLFQVKDTGPGIPDGQLDAIFGRFQQCKGKGLLHAKGHGLGLSISRQLAELMSGQVTVSSELGKGSTFEVQIPIEEAPAVHPPQPAGLSAQNPAFHCSSPARVLVLEDDPLSRSYLENFLQKEGLAYHACANGQEALHALESHIFDLALLDLHTPLLNGHEVAINLRNSPGNPNCNIPLIALSGGYFAEDEPNYAEAGINHFLYKPYYPEQLKHLLWQLAAKPQDDAAMQKFLFSPNFDVQALTALYGENYRQLQSMFEAFLRNTPKILDNMVEKLEQENWQERAGQAHKVKPSFSLVGWQPVADLAKKIEEECLASKEKGCIMRKFLKFRMAAYDVLDAVAGENQRLISFQANNNPQKHAYLDRR